MNPDTLVVVSAYAGDLKQVENNMPLYRHHKCPVLVLSPSDAPITEVSGAHHCAWLGLKGWIGKHTLERQRLFFEAMLNTNKRYFLLNDADSVCLSAKLPDYLYNDPDVLWSNEVLDTNPAPCLLPKLALQPPYFFSRKVLKGLLKAAENPPMSYLLNEKSPEGWPLPFPTECIDHWMLQVACGSGYPHKSFPDGQSFETTSDHGLNVMSEHVRVRGSIFIHQVKTLAVLKQLWKDRGIFLGK